MSEKIYMGKQAMTVLMVLLQKSLFEQSDIVPELEALEFEVKDGGELVVKNPPKSMKAGECDCDCDECCEEEN